MTLSSHFLQPAPSRTPTPPLVLLRSPAAPRAPRCTPSPEAVETGVPLHSPAELPADSCPRLLGSVRASPRALLSPLPPASLPCLFHSLGPSLGTLQFWESRCSHIPFYLEDVKATMGQSPAPPTGRSRPPRVAGCPSPVLACLGGLASTVFSLERASFHPLSSVLSCPGRSLSKVPRHTLPTPVPPVLRPQKACFNC